jgi:acyl-CoA reductase-like NAD-dependent aldehyde dehydrogenase
LKGPLRLRKRGNVNFNQMLINGVWIPASSGATWNLIDPSSETEISKVAFGDSVDAAAAIDAASEAFESWRDLGPYRRATLLHRAADLLVERADEYAAITSEESGKPFSEARGEWLSAPDYLRFAAEEAKRVGGRIIPSMRPGRRIEVTYSPIGVVGVIAAWNFPVYNVNRAVSSALAAGCTVVSIIRALPRYPGSVPYRKICKQTPGSHRC